MKKRICMVFDVDGTLFDTKMGIIQALNYVLVIYKRSELSINEQDKYIGPPIKDSLMKFQGMDEQEALKATALYRTVYVKHYIENSLMYHGMKEVLDSLKNRGGILGIATMKTLPQIERLFEISKITRHFFDVIETAKEDGSRSKFQMLLEIQRKYVGQKEIDFYMIGDTENDYYAAQNAGFNFIAADYGYGTILDDNIKHIKRPADILKIIFE